MKIYYEGNVQSHVKAKCRKFYVYELDEFTLKYELTQDKFCLVDKNDFDLLVSKIWRSQYDASIQSYYALCNITKNDVISMHRFIVNIPPKFEEITIDHKNRNTLDNRKTNLRLATPMQQCFNQKVKSSKITSTYRGVSVRNDVPLKRYRVRAQCLSGEQINLGSYYNEKQAAEVWDNFMYEEYKDHDPLKGYSFNNIKGERTLNFIPFNFPKKLI